MARIDELQLQANALLGTAPSAAEAATAALPDKDPGAPFSPFVPAQLAQAVAVAERLVEVADAAGGEEGIAAALAEARTQAEAHPPQLVQHALHLFIVHHPEGSRLAIPAIEPMPEAERRGAFTADQAETDVEAALDYLREDLLANEHHRHWHAVYPATGWMGRRQDREGELFFYMHEQMLARYDAERRAAGLDPVAPFADYREPIDQGYGDRPPDRRLVDIDIPEQQLSLSVAELEAQRDAIFRAVTRGDFTHDHLVAGLDALGQAEEPQLGSTFGGWHHGAGHMACAWTMHPDGGGDMGVIGNTRTAIRDPFFWRWHRHIDELAFELQNRYPPHTFEDAPAVALRDEDLILCFEDQLPAAARGDEALAAQWARDTFGGERFDAAAGDAVSTDTLETWMAETPFDPADPQTVPVRHLTHRPFCVAVRMRGTADERRRVTVRLFMAPAVAAEDRRAWIELDKFDGWIEAGEAAVLLRPMRLSSVARKPTTPEPRFVQPPAQSRREQYCRCGWPYHLLLPRGTADGMPFRIAAIVTDFARDVLEGDPDCGSLSFCGSMDRRFPDRREMGYPFNRPFGERSIAQTLMAEPSMAARDVVVRHLEAP